MSKKTVDFIPNMLITGDLIKVSDEDIGSQNIVVSSIVTLLSMERGSNQLTPEIGEKENVMKLFYMDETDLPGLLTKIESNILSYTGRNVSLSYTLDQNDNSICYLNVTIDGLPGSTKLSISKKRKLINIVSSSSFV